MIEKWRLPAVVLCSTMLLVAACGSSSEPSGGGGGQAPTLEEQVCAGDHPDYLQGSPPAVSLSFGLDCELEDGDGALCEQFFFEFELPDGEVIGYEGAEQLTRIFDFSHRDEATGLDAVLIALDTRDEPFDNGFHPVMWLTIPTAQYATGTVSLTDLTHRGNIDDCFDDASCPILQLRALENIDTGQSVQEYQLGIAQSGLLLIDSPGSEPGEQLKMSATDVSLAVATELYQEVLCDDGMIWFRR